MSQSYQRLSSYNMIGGLTSEQTVTVRQDGTFTTWSDYEYTSHFATSAGEYLLGNLGLVTTWTWKNGAGQPTSRTRYGYQWRDGPQQSLILLQPDIVKAPMQDTTLTYTPEGALRQVAINDGRPRLVTYRTNAEGQVIRRDEAVMPYMMDDPVTGWPTWQTPVTPHPHEVWYRLGGNEWGYVTNNRGTFGMSAAAAMADRRETPGSGRTRGTPSF